MRALRWGGAPRASSNAQALRREDAAQHQPQPGGCRRQRWAPDGHAIKAAALELLLRARAMALAPGSGGSGLPAGRPQLRLLRAAAASGGARLSWRPSRPSSAFQGRQGGGGQGRARAVGSGRREVCSNTHRSDPSPARKARHFEALPKVPRSADRPQAMARPPPTGSGTPRRGLIHSSRARVRLGPAMTASSDSSPSCLNSFPLTRVAPLRILTALHVAAGLPARRCRCGRNAETCGRARNQPRAMVDQPVGHQPGCGDQARRHAAMIGLQALGNSKTAPAEPGASRSFGRLTGRCR